MGLIFAIIGGIAGWKVGDLHWRYFGIVAAMALVPAIIALMMFISIATIGSFVSAWLAAFAYVAIPFSLLAWLKKKRVENRADD